MTTRTTMTSTTTEAVPYFSVSLDGERMQVVATVTSVDQLRRFIRVLEANEELLDEPKAEAPCPPEGIDAR
jgi:hypothetical protein